MRDEADLYEAIRTNRERPSITETFNENQISKDEEEYYKDKQEAIDNGEITAEQTAADEREVQGDIKKENPDISDEELERVFGEPLKKSQQQDMINKGEKPILTPTEPNEGEKIAIGRMKGEIGRGESIKSRVVIPEGPIGAPTTGKQESMFGTQKGETPDLFDNKSTLASPGQTTKGAAIPSQEEFNPIPEGQRRSFLIKKISKILDVPIRIGKFKNQVAGAKAGGIYKREQKVVRLAKANDLGTAIHEVAHHFEAILGLPNKMPKEIQAMAYANAKDLNREGFAEFVRYYVTNETKAKTEAPEFYKKFEEALHNAPDVDEVLIKAKEAWSVWQSSSSVEKLHSFIVSGGPKKAFPTLTEMYTKIKDALYPIQQAVDIIERSSGKKLDIEDNAYLMARLTRGWSRKAEQYLKYGTFQYDSEKGIQITGKGLLETLIPIDKAGEIDMLDTYLIAKRAASDPRIRKGFSGILSRDDFETVVKELEPKFGEVAQEIYRYSNELLTFLVNSGRMSEGTAKIIRDKNLFYAPLYRLMDNESMMGGLSSKKFSQLFNPVKKLKGSSRDILSPTESLLYNTFTMINVAERNRVGKAFIAMSKLPGVGKIIERVPPPMQVSKVPGKEALEQILNSMGNKEEWGSIIDALPEESIPEFVMAFRPNYQPRPNEVIFYENGHAIQFELAPELAKALTNINASDMSLLTKILSLPAKVLRAGATTYSAEFPIRNPFKDQMTAFIQSEYHFIPAWDFMNGLMHLLKKDEIWQAYNASGAAHSAVVSVDRHYIAKNLKEMMQDWTIKGMLKHPLEFMQIFSELTEEGTRVGEFAKGFAQNGKDYRAMLQAGFDSRKVTVDFANQGEATSRAINMISAFWNAGLEGNAQMVKSFKNHPWRTSMKVFLGVTLPTLLLWWHNKDDPYYQDLPTWRKVGAWNIITHNADGTLKHIWSLPRAFEYGILFGAIPESILDSLYKKNPDSFKKTGLQAIQSFNFLPTPTAITPLIEWWADKSMYFGGKLVPRDKEDLEPVLQYGSHTKETTKLIARMMDKIPGLKEVASPAKIENMIKGYTGGAGNLGLQTGDWLIKTLGVVKTPPMPSMRLEDIPGLKGFLVNYPAPSSQSIEDFYDKYNELNMEWESTKQRAQVRGYGLKIEAPKQLQQYEMVAKALSLERKIVDQIYNSNTLTPDAKRKDLTNMYVTMINTARAGLNQTKLPEAKK